MDDKTFEAVRLREEALASVEQMNEQLAERQRWIDAEGPVTWTPPQPDRQPLRPVRRAPEPERRELHPPMPTKVNRTVHDAAGRIVSLEHYEGPAVSQLYSWEKFVADQIAAAEQRAKAYAAECCKNLGEAAGDVVAEISTRDQGRVKSAVETLAEEVGRDVGKLAKQIAEQTTLIERLARRLEQLEARAAPPPKLITDAAD